MSTFMKKTSSLIGIIFGGACVAGAVQTQVMVQGYLTNTSGTPYTTPQTAELKVYQGGVATTAGSGTLYYDETATVSPSASGVFNYPLGSGTPTTPVLVVPAGTIGNVLSSTTFDTSSPVFLEISVGGNVMLPRIQMLGMPFASLATTAEHLKPTDSVVATSATLTGSGASTYSLRTSSGITVAAGMVTAPAFVGTLYGTVFGSGGTAPIGALLPYAGTTEPTGWVECDGRSISQSGTASASWGNYNTASLFAALGTVWGSAGAGVFNIPDLRGIFPRGYNHGKVGSYFDPDAGSRVSQYASGATGDAIGSYQLDQFKSHNHNAGASSPAVGISGGPTAAVFGQGVTTSSGGNETRPANASVMYIIRVE